MEKLEQIQEYAKNLFFARENSSVLQNIFPTPQVGNFSQCRYLCLFNLLT